MSAGFPPHDGGPGVRIAEFRPEHAEAAAALILAVQRGEFGLDIDLGRQPDLADIPGFYQHGAGQFWVALDGEAVVGTLALKDIGGGLAALRKMFVAPTHRGGTGTAGRLLHAALARARRHGLRGIVLGTTEQFLAAHRFYEKHGFVPVPRENLPPGFPLMAVDTRFYRLDLALTPESV
jgi:GNAT superfamily N-acetyltransferase